MAKRSVQLCTIRLLLFWLLATSALVQSVKAEEFEFMHLWLTDSERQAMSILQHAIEGEGLVWREHPVEKNFSGIRAKFSERFALGRPPTASFWVGGKDLGKFVDTGIFRAISDSPSRPRLADVLVPEVLQLIEHGKGYSALPLGIHLQNIIVFNRSIFEGLQLKVPESWQQFLDVAPAILKAGYTPLSMSDQLWQLRFLFTSILAEQLDADELSHLFEHADRTSDPVKQKLQRSLEVFDQLRPFVNADNHDLSWEKAAQAVANGGAAAIVMGDFLAPLFSDDEKFQCGLTPGSKFVLWSVDVAVFPETNSASQQAAQELAIRAWSRPDVLDRYVAKKGGVSVVVNSNATYLSRCSQQSARAWASGAPRIPLVTTLWSNQLNRLSSVVGGYWADRSSKSISDVVELMLIALTSH
ncbi:MAG: extracellular solute-binding protein [Hyphomicrobium sp.]|nr:extracellular solute-binding protein [Hyphomicrobium sp.]